MPDEYLYTVWQEENQQAVSPLDVNVEVQFHRHLMARIGREIP
jgi:hypothetical protein